MSFTTTSDDSEYSTDFFDFPDEDGNENDENRESENKNSENEENEESKDEESDEESRSEEDTATIMNDDNTIHAITSETNVNLTTQNSIGALKIATVRTYIEELPDGSSHCKFCTAKWGKKTSTTTIRRHFERKHPSTHTEMYQRRINTYRFEPYKKTGYDKIKVETIEEALIRWIIIDQQSFSVVNNEPFRFLLQKLDPRFQIPCRQTIAKRIHNEFEVQRQLLKQFLENEIPGKLSMTTDIWTAYNQQAFLGITIHWINKEWQIRSMLLDIIPLHDPHTGDLIAETITNTIREFEIGKRLLGVTTDNGSNMISMMNKLKTNCSQEFNNDEVTHHRCIAHVLNLAVKDGLEYISDNIKKTRTFTNRLRNSVLMIEEMKEIASALKEKFKMPENDVATRWNSTYLMLKRLDEIRSITDILVGRHRNLAVNYPTGDDWDNIKV